MARVVTTTLGGGREDLDAEDGYKRWDAAGLLVEQRPLTPAELARVEEAAVGDVRETTAAQLRTQARNALEGIAADIAEDDTIISTSTNQAVVALAQHDKARAQQMRSVIRLIVGRDLLD